MSRLCFLIQFYLSPAFSISRRPCHSENKRQTRYLVLPRLAHKFLNYPPTNLPQTLTHPATLTHTIYWKPLFFWSRLWLCSQNQAEGKCFLRKTWARELHSHLIFLHQDDFVCSSSRLLYPWFFFFFFFSCKTCFWWSKKSTGIYFSLVVKNQNPIHMYELLSILVKCH